MVFDANTILACTVAGGVVGGSWPTVTSRFLSWKYQSIKDEWQENFNQLENWRVRHTDAWPSSQADGQEGLLGVWLDAQAPRKIFGYMTTDEAFALASIGYPIESIPGTTVEDDVRRANGFALKVTPKLGALCALVAAVVGGAAAAFVGIQAVAWVILLALFSVCAYTDVKCRHTSWQVWAALDVVAVLYQVAFNGLGLDGLGGSLIAALVVCGIFFLSTLPARFLMKRRAKKNGSEDTTMPSPVGVGDYMIVVPAMIAVGLHGSLWCLGAALVSIIVHFIISLATAKNSRTFPFAPYLTFGVAVGLVVPVLFGA